MGSYFEDVFTGFSDPLITSVKTQLTQDHDLPVCTLIFGKIWLLSCLPISPWSLLTEYLARAGDYSSELLANPGGEFGNTTGWTATVPRATPQPVGAR